MPWQPDSTWSPLTPGSGISNGGVWRTSDGLVVKRLLPGAENPAHYTYWRRQAEVAASRLLETTTGLRAPRCVRVEHDPDGITLWTEAIDGGAVEVIDAAAALGRFNANELKPADWFARQVLRDRLANDERRGGWVALESAAVVPEPVRRSGARLWSRRHAVLAELDRLPQTLVHGDFHPLNLLGRDGDVVIATDWEQFGIGPVGFDLGYLLLSTDHPLEKLVAAYRVGDAEVVRRGTVLTAAVTAVARAAWSLGQPEPGDHVERLVRLADVVAEAVEG
ncbi:hypothetical protein GCM10009745_82970 [Kribbella yunnanensis]|uniref:Aminoglycoside phosphotransferase domain-containing protein n=1 Tax=Kribbella yunnanensis TaxID=190194 RepID=A0ABP4VER9_9ACTN